MKSDNSRFRRWRRLDRAERTGIRSLLIRQQSELRFDFYKDDNYMAQCYLSVKTLVCIMSNYGIACDRQFCGRLQISKLGQKGDPFSDRKSACISLQRTLSQTFHQSRVTIGKQQVPGETGSSHSRPNSRPSAALSKHAPGALESFISEGTFVLGTL